MSWREILGAARVIADIGSHNPHVMQNEPACKGSADIADIAEVDSRLMEVLADAISALPISPVEVRDALGADEIEEWRFGRIVIGDLVEFARWLIERKGMGEGWVPEYYDKHAICSHCGPVWYWLSGEIDSCAWCANRRAGLPVPRPRSVHCRDCVHFNRIEHPHLGHCDDGQREALFGLWDDDLRCCDAYIGRTVGKSRF